MATDSNEFNKQQITTSITHKYPSFRDEPLKTVYRWLEGKRKDDEAEGLWRIHNGIYDLTNFINNHPGGRDWIELTKGTDITEAFETHHITLKAEILLPKFKIRDAAKPRNIKLTFNEDGFYRTLKAKIRNKLNDVDRKPELYSKLIIDSLLALTFIFAFLSVKASSYALATICGLFLVWTTIAAHNFFHKKDNWRMMTFNLSFFSYREWRVSHAMSHHLYTNSLLDLEMSWFEPFLVWLPDPKAKNIIQRFGAWFYGPILYALIIKMEFVKRFFATVVKGDNIMFKEDLITLILPIFMVALDVSNFVLILELWVYIVTVASFLFGLIGLNAAHHHPDIVHPGDGIPKNVDFAVYQIATVIDRADLKGSQFMVLTHFGDHCLHHLFPTLDHGILPQLYPIFYETCKEFETVYRECSWLHHIIGQNQQLARIEPKTYVPSKKML